MADKRHENSCFSPGELGRLYQALERLGYRVAAPVMDGLGMGHPTQAAPTLEEEATPDRLPAGWREEQEAGRYRLAPDPSGRLFATLHGPQSYKKFLFPPLQESWRAVRQAAGKGQGATWRVVPPGPPPKLALIGLRACDLAAVAVQDKVFGRLPYPDQPYQARRQAALLIGVQCHRMAPTCFCHSQNTGPAIRPETHGVDILLTELAQPAPHRLVAQAFTEKGRQALSQAQLPPATPDDLAQALSQAQQVEKLASQQKRAIPAGAPQALRDNPGLSAWEQVAIDCTGCGGCTLSCPTCFCSTTQEAPSLDGQQTARVRSWDSCFGADHSYIHGTLVRGSITARYRQWAAHKLGWWQEQMGVDGCVGCGRCITWCPVGVDITQTAQRINQAATEQPAAPQD